MSQRRRTRPSVSITSRTVDRRLLVGVLWLALPGAVTASTAAAAFSDGVVQSRRPLPRQVVPALHARRVQYTVVCHVTIVHWISRMARPIAPSYP